MTDAHDPISEDEISICDAFDIVYRTITPDWQILEADERLKTSSPYLDDPRDRANRAAWRSYDQARLGASEWLREKLGQGALIALFWDPEKKKNQQISRVRWVSMGDFETMGVFETGIAIIVGVRRTVFFNRKSFDDFMKEIARPDSDRAPRPDDSTPTASKDRPDHQQKILDIYRQLFPGGYKGRAKKRDQAIMREFQRRYQDQVSVRTIQRALKSLKSD
jgi:hypothetical protein